jgi:hypothetical protein
VSGHRFTSDVDDDLQWRAVGPEQPCPVCRGTDGCGIAGAEGFVLCRTVPSEHPVDVGGWLHTQPERPATR